MTASEMSGAQGAVPRRWTYHWLNSGLIFGLTVRLVALLPRPLAYAMGRTTTWIAWRLMPQTNDAVADNLAVLFPHETVEQRRHRALAVYRSYANDTVDFLRALAVPDERLPHVFAIRDEDRAIFDDVLAAGRGALMVTGHFGCWEVGGLLMKVLGLPLTIVAMAEADPEVNRLRADTRARMGVETLEVRQSLETALSIRRRLGENRLVAMLIDRHLGRDRVAVTLFGRPTFFLQTPAVMAYLSGAPLVPCFLERVGPGRFTTFAAPPIVVDRTLPREAAIQQATQRVAAVLQSRIERNPHAWYHFYRYWDAQRDEYGELTRQHADNFHGRTNRA